MGASLARTFKAAAFVKHSPPYHSENCALGSLCPRFHYVQSGKTACTYSPIHHFSFTQNPGIARAFLPDRLALSVALLALTSGAAAHSACARFLPVIIFSAVLPSICIDGTYHITICGQKKNITD